MSTEHRLGYRYTHTHLSSAVLLAATYLQSVSFEQTTSGVRVSCEFAVSDQDLQCRVTISSGAGFTLSVTARVEEGSRPPVASVVTSDLPQEMLMFSAVAQRVSDGEAIEDFMATGNVSMIQDGGTSGLCVCVCPCLSACVCVSVCVHAVCVQYVY